MGGAASSTPAVAALPWIRVVSRSAWIRYLAGGLVAAVVVLPWSGWPGTLLFNLVQLSGAAAVLIGARRHWQRGSWSWRLIVAGFVSAVLADAVWTLAPALRSMEVFFGLLGVLFLAKQLLLTIGLILVVPRRSAQWWWDASLDGVIVSAGLAVALWMFVAQPIVRSGHFGVVATGGAMVYVLADLFVLAALARLMFISSIRSAAGTLLAGSVCCLLLADAWYCVTLSTDHPFVPSDASLLSWMACAVLLGAAALHPSVKDLGRPSRRALAGASKARMATFVVLALLGPVIAATVVVGGHSSRPRLTWADDLVPAVLTTLLSVLLVLRLGLLLKLAHDRAGALQRSLQAQERLQHQLSYRALHDPLTGLGNRALLNERLDRWLAAPEPAFVLLMLDLDGFKDVNDNLGHPTGDQLLIEVAGRLSAVITEADALVRLGGDEFAILLPWDDLDHAQRLARWVLDVVQSPYLLGGREIYLTTSVGLLLRQSESRTASDALRDADLALYAAKSAGKNRMVVFDASLRQAQADRARLSDGLRRPEVYDELELHYQPIVDLATGRPYAVEALLRWTPVGGEPVSPTEFVPMAEETGVIVPIGRWAVGQAVAQVKPWFERYGVAVSVNVSALQLKNHDFADQVLELLTEHDVPGDALIVELTESVLIGGTVTDAEVVETSLRRLRARGVQVAIDDFGTGYSSLSYLCQLPVDILKIDHLFTGQLLNGGPNGRRAALIRAILDVGRSLRLQTVAEGIETEEQARRLRMLKCPLAQGYLFSAPLLPAALDEYLTICGHPLVRDS
jgi:diguanylate cyclase (GGDEF)-like protein